ncbi:uncharacterized protein [Nicotiana tomentosiformis]|uniref:uncharacterized protein n=1 Tax=Nicotiana tomentosiformis TaxID=4098 RepID=UPI00388C484A
MAKKSKTVPQEEKASSSRPAGNKTPVEPRIEECIPGPRSRASKVEASPWFSGAVPDLAGWVRQLVSTSSYAERSWRDLAKGRWEAKNHGLGDNVATRLPPLREGEAPKPTKEKKRRRASTPDTPKPKKRRALKSKSDPCVLSADVVQTLRDEDEEGEDVDYLLVSWKREGTEASRTAEPVTVKEVQSQIEATALHREASSKYRAELARCSAEGRIGWQLHEEAKIKEAETLGWKQNMDRLTSEKETEEKLDRAQKVEELETRLAAELARATSEAEALVASYRADTEAANTRAKEISNAAEVRLSCVAEHTRRQSRRETLKEVHARGFDLTADIENAKVLEDEAGALLSDEEDSASGSESGDEDEAPEDAAPEAD